MRELRRYTEKEGRQAIVWQARIPPRVDGRMVQDGANYTGAGPLGWIPELQRGTTGSTISDRCALSW